MALRYKYDRQIIRSIERLKDKYPILAITGPRQSGKTTMLLRSYLKDSILLFLAGQLNR